MSDLNLAKQRYNELAGVRQMNRQRFSSVWDAIEDSSENAENLKLRSRLMIQLSHYIANAELSQAEAAEVLGVTQPRISDLVRGKINLFTIDTLVNMATAAGLRVEMQLVATP